MSKFIEDVAWPLGAFLALCFFLCASSKGAEREPFSVAFKPLPRTAVALEAAWQAENFIDISQTLQIAREPAQYREVGTLSLFAGAHPSQRQVWVGSIAFGVAHYAVSQALYDADMPRALYAWQLLTLGYKTWDIHRNCEVGLK